MFQVVFTLLYAAFSNAYLLVRQIPSLFGAWFSLLIIFNILPLLELRKYTSVRLGVCRHGYRDRYFQRDIMCSCRNFGLPERNDMRLLRVGSFRNKKSGDRSALRICADTQSVGSVLLHPSGGRFPLNFTYRLAKYFDGKNDGLVSVSSCERGDRHRFLEPTGDRGISH